MKRFIALIHYALGDLGAVLINLFLFLWVFRMRSPESFGAIAVAQTVIFWVQPLIKLGIDVSAPRYLAQHSSQRFALLGEFVRMRLTVATVAAVCVTAAALFTQPLVCWTLIAAIPLLWAEALQLDFACIGVGRSSVLKYSRWIGALLPAPLIIVSCYQQWHPATILLAQLGGVLVAVSYQWRQLQLRLSHLLLPSPLRAGSIFRDVLSTTVAQFCVAGYNVADLFLLGLLNMVDLPQLGEYRVGNRLVLLSAIPLVAAIRTISGDLAMAYAQHSNSDIVRLERLFKRFMWGAGTLIALCIVFVAPPCLAWIANRPLPLVSDMAPWLGLSLLMTAWHNPYVTTLPMRGLNQSYLAINIIGLLVALVSGLILIPLLGLIGAPLCIATAYLVMGLLGRRQHRFHSAQAVL